MAKKKKRENWWESQLILAWIAILLTVIGFGLEKYFSTEERKMQDLNYKISCESPKTMGRNDIDYTLGPFVFRLNRPKLSGEFKSLFVATIKNGELDMVEMNASNYNNFGYTFNNQMQLFNSNKNSKSLVTMKYFIMPPSEEDGNWNRYGIFHMILKGYNHSYQYFTIIYYFKKPKFADIQADGFYHSEIVTHILENDDIYFQGKMDQIALEICENANIELSKELLSNQLESNLILIKNKLQGG